MWTEKDLPSPYTTHYDSLLIMIHIRILRVFGILIDEGSGSIIQFSNYFVKIVPPQDIITLDYRAHV